MQSTRLSPTQRSRLRSTTVFTTRPAHPATMSIRDCMYPHQIQTLQHATMRTPISMGICTPQCVSSVSALPQMLKANHHAHGKDGMPGLWWCSFSWKYCPSSSNSLYQKRHHTLLAAIYHFQRLGLAWSMVV